MARTADSRRWSVVANLPALPAASGLCAGVVIFTLSGSVLLPVIAALAGAVALFRKHYVAGTISLACALGWCAASLNEPTTPPAGFTDGSEISFTGTVRRVVPKSYRDLYIIDVDSVGRTSDRLIAVRSFGVAVSDSWAQAEVIPGNRVIVRTRLRDVAEGAYPGKINYYRNLGVSAFGTLLQGNISVTGDEVNFNGFWYRQRMNLSALLAENRLSAETFGLLNALLLGLGDDLPADYRENFRLTGTAHVLALSGFHIGFIYALISLVLFPFGVSWRLRAPRFMISIVAVWCYALLTGLTPGVVRATLSLSVVLAGLVCGRLSDSLNNLCVAVALMVCVWPYCIFLAGMQLSVCATAGILLFAHLFRPVGGARWRYRVADLVAVPCGAVFATAPLLMYYFHSLPPLFLLSNFIAVLFIGPLVWAGVVRILLTAVGIAAPWLDSVLNFAVDIAGRTFGMISDLPGDIGGSLSVSAPQAMCLMTALLLTAVVVTRRTSPSALRWAVPTALLLCVTPFVADAEPESESFVLRHSGIATVVVRHKRSAAALVRCDDREYPGVAESVRGALVRYNRGGCADTIRVTRADVTLGPFVRTADSLFIENRSYSLAELTDGTYDKIY
ncbi:MAG: ComEC family competence protein [Muribaculaceae bacterium]|nr:ComEC family competence protein [Muribaculaceae bacterium]